MARIRTIKPEFFTSEDVVSLSPLARLLFIATWCEADKAGRLQWKPKTLKMRYLPSDRCDIEALCGELVAAGLVCKYGDGLAFIPAFARHQHLNPRETSSFLPEPDACPTRHDASARVNAPCNSENDVSILELHAQGGREGKGREGNTRDASSGFADFWCVFPNRKAKAAAEKAWQKLKPDPVLQGVILKAVEVQSAAPAWTKEAGAYIPHAATWLNGQRWRDEVGVQAGEVAFESNL